MPALKPFLLAFFGIAVIAATPVRQRVSPKHNLQPTAPKTLFFDDFNTGRLDRSKWNVVVTGFHVNNEMQAYVDSDKTLFEENGQLVFQPCYTPGFVTRDGQHFDFISARINTRDKFAEDITNWHVYAVDWTPDSLNFSYDGHPMFRVTRGMTSLYGSWAFDKKEFLILNFALGGAYPSKVNGIKSPYDGLPASTVEEIKAHKTRMYVDWVKVTQ